MANRKRHCLYCTDQIESGEDFALARNHAGFIVGVVHGVCLKQWNIRQQEKAARQEAHIG